MVHNLCTSRHILILLIRGKQQVLADMPEFSWFNAVQILLFTVVRILLFKAVLLLLINANKITIKDINNELT